MIGGRNTKNELVEKEEKSCVNADREDRGKVISQGKCGQFCQLLHSC